MTRASTKLLLAAFSAAALAAAAAACGGAGSDDNDPGAEGTPTPAPPFIPFEVCVAHFEVDAGDAPEVGNLLLVVLLSEYWVGDATPVGIDGLNGAIYADYHYNFDGAPLPEYVGAISTNATVAITSSNLALGTTASLDITADPLWTVTTDTASTVTGGSGATIDGVLQPLADCAGDCIYGTGSASLLVNGSALTLGTANPDGIAILYCRDLPATFAGWRPGKPLPPGFREAFGR